LQRQAASLQTAASLALLQLSLTLAATTPLLTPLLPLPPHIHHRCRMVFVVVLSLSLTFLNYRGLNVVGHTAMTTTVFIITPFLLLCGLAAPYAEPRNWLAFDASTVQWSTFLNIMFWNLK
jgi:amino acid transporter